MNDMKYSISETPLKLKEYGRNIQSMVEYAKTIEDREKRTKTSNRALVTSTGVLCEDDCPRTALSPFSFFSVDPFFPQQQSTPRPLTML